MPVRHALCAGVPTLLHDSAQVHSPACGCAWFGVSHDADAVVGKGGWEEWGAKSSEFHTSGIEDLIGRSRSQDMKTIEP